MHNSFFLKEPFELLTPFTPFSTYDLSMFSKSNRSRDHFNSPTHRSGRDSTPISADYQLIARTASNTPRPESRQRVRSNSTTSVRPVVATIDHHKNKDRNTWSAGSAPVISQRTLSNLTSRNQSQTNLHLSTSNSPATPIQRTFSNQSIQIPSNSKRFSKSPQYPPKRRAILFYNKHDPHYGFTNFSNHAVKYGNKVYPTSEHLFQSLKVRILLRPISNPSDLTGLVLSPPVVG
jgi:hypothetical protein